MPTMPSSHSRHNGTAQANPESVTESRTAYQSQADKITKGIEMTIKILDPQTALERNAARWIMARAAEYDGGLTADNVKKVVSELLQYGCVSGQVGHLIYYKDTLAFYRKHRAEIQKMITDDISEGLLSSPADLNGWDNDDPFARDTQNQNLLAWYGFEQAARNLADRAELEI